MCSQWVLTNLVSSVSHSNSVLILPNFSWHHNLRTSQKLEMNPQFTPRWLHASIYFLSLFTSCRKVPWAPPISSTCTCILLCPVPSCTTHSFLMFFYHQHCQSLDKYIPLPNIYWSQYIHTLCFYLPIPYHSIALLFWLPVLYHHAFVNHDIKIFVSTT